MKNRTDLILGEAFCIFIFFYFLDSGLSVLNGLQFYFRLRDSENRELTECFLILHLLRKQDISTTRLIELNFPLIFLKST